MTGLYDPLILDHNRSPRNSGRVAAATHEAKAVNPLCGDRIGVTLRIHGDSIDSMAHECQGCALCKASASLLSERLIGMRVEEFADLWSAMGRLVAGEPSESDVRDLASLAVFRGIQANPMRRKCVTLPWHAVECALTDGRDGVAHYDAWRAR